MRKRFWVTLALVVAVAACLSQLAPTAWASAALCGLPWARSEVAQVEMEPTLMGGDVVAYAAVAPPALQRGDIVVIGWRAWTGDDGPNAVMRVIGLPGDRITLSAGSVVRNGTVLIEPYIPVDQATEPEPLAVGAAPSAWVVPPGSVFVLGDFRMAAADSRAYGLLPDGAILGRASFRCAPADRFGPIP